MITDKSDKNNITRGAWSKENIRHNSTTRIAKVPDTW